MTGDTAILGGDLRFPPNFFVVWVCGVLLRPIHPWVCCLATAAIIDVPTAVAIILGEGSGRSASSAASFWSSNTRLA